ncbi:MAG: hypothetical protein KDC12_10735 [Flavobacteriales bacterium]|nr:hypothetical protein [Flavobacteriales bacterium]
MKNLIILMLTALAVGLGSCSRLKCRNMDCGNGTCEKGECICDDGYEGASCQDLSRDKYLGIYTGTEECSVQGTSTVSVVVDEGYNDLSILFENLFNTNSEIQATMSGSSFTIPLQTNYAGNVIFNVVGSGHFSGNQLVVNYTVEEDGESESCSVTLSR